MSIIIKTPQMESIIDDQICYCKEATTYRNMESIFTIPTGPISHKNVGCPSGKNISIYQSMKKHLTAKNNQVTKGKIQSMREPTQALPMLFFPKNKSILIPFISIICSFSSNFFIILFQSSKVFTSL
eukprot:c14907_g3_i1 orf=2-379(-)